MGQNHQSFVLVNPRERLEALGLDEAAAAAFRRVAASRAPEVSRSYADLFTAAFRSEGLEALPPRWRSPWPAPWREALSWRRARNLAVAAVQRVHPALGKRACAVVKLGRVRISRTAAPLTTPARFGPPRVTTCFDGGAEGALILAHELGHAAQMSVRPLGPSRPAPPMAAAEVAALVTERAFHAVYREAGHLRAATARMADDHLALLVRHPARDALEATPQEWTAIAQRYAPGLAWTADPPPLTPRARAEPLSTLGYAMAAACATALFARMEDDEALRRAYLAWMDAGPAARFEDACALIGARADDPALYEAAYDVAVTDLERARRLA
jgi:hypothetical protein